MSIAIKAENISKAYQLGQIGTGTIGADFERWFARIRGKEDPFLRIGEENDRTKKGTSNMVWSLQDINFEIMQGDAVGVIGRNGAGKSTLLKLLSRVTAPTSGRISAKGRIASLLEVGTGFHPDLTGKENIFLNGAILGMRKKEISRKLDEIIEFSGVERYIDTPVKRYSSGMYVRLAFAVAAHLESEILIVDEVLAVGDAEFQKKCLGKMGDVSNKEGRTVLFVSHQLHSISELCKHTMLLKNGRLQLFDQTDKVLKKYLESGLNDTITFEKDLKRVTLKQVKDTITFTIDYQTDYELDIPNFGFVFKNSLGIIIFGGNLNMYISDIEIPRNTSSGSIQLNIKQPVLLDDMYTVSIWFGHSKENSLEALDCLSLEVVGMAGGRQYSTALVGNSMPHCEWSFSNNINQL